MSTEIDDWATITHEANGGVGNRPHGGVYTARTADGELVGTFVYYWLDHPARTKIQFGDVSIAEPFRRRRVATALLRQLNIDQPQARINPGMRNAEGQAYMDHILSSEKEKVATNGILDVPLSTMLPPGFRPADNRAKLGA